VSASPSLPSLNHTGPSPPPAIASPPLASINPTLSRRRSDYVNPSAEAVSSLHQGRPLPLPLPAIDYLSAQHILRPPPAVASSALERQDRPRGTSLCLWRARDWCWWKWER
jgi:ubiquitin carboxyl-terminal hydrolase 8